MTTYNAIEQNDDGYQRLGFTEKLLWEFPPDWAEPVGWSSTQKN